MALEKFKYISGIIMFGVLASVVFAVEKPTTPQKTCVTEECHADYGRKAFVHGPVGLGDCKSCHEAVEPQKHSYKLVRQGKELCEYCHLEQAVKKHVHKPLETGDCIQCHNPHSSDNKFFLPKKTIAELCYQCHETGKDMKFPHGPVAIGECTVCHDSHSEDHEKLLRAEPSELCLSCHVVTKNELKKFEFVHKPAQDNCIGCHDSHGAENSMMLKAQAPQLCYPCHEDVKKIAETAEYKHSAITEKNGCMNCHTPHASTVKYCLKDAPENLCMSCHDKPVGISKDEILPSFTEEVKDKKFPHGPIAEKNCNGCHNSHGSKNFRLLTKKYPSQFYAPFSEENYELCFSCHEKSLVLTPQTADLTDFRNGTQNLHFLHVNKEERGRTCRSCHATHASNMAKHIRESVPYGMWTMPIQFQKTETGGSCWPGCHIPFSYDRQTAVSYEKPKTENSAAKAQTGSGM